MDRNFDELLQDVLALDRQSQALLAERIVDTLAGTPEHETAWRSEVRRRIEEIDSGKVQMRDAKDVIQDARTRLRH